MAQVFYTPQLTQEEIARNIRLSKMTLTNPDKDNPELGLITNGDENVSWDDVQYFGDYDDDSYYP